MNKIKTGARELLKQLLLEHGFVKQNEDLYFKADGSGREITVEFRVQRVLKRVKESSGEMREYKYRIARLEFDKIVR